MGFKKLGSKLASKVSLGSGAFDLADDLRNLFRTTSTQQKQPKTAVQAPIDRFYAEAQQNSQPVDSSRNSSTRTSTDNGYKAYYSKRTTFDYDGWSDDNQASALSKQHTSTGFSSLPLSLEYAATAFASCPRHGKRKLVLSKRGSFAPVGSHSPYEVTAKSYKVASNSREPTRYDLPTAAGHLSI